MAYRNEWGNLEPMLCHWLRLLGARRWQRCERDAYYRAMGDSRYQVRVTENVRLK